MTSITHSLASQAASEHLRPFDARRDLERVADLIEQCFAETLDPDGQRYLQQMRSAARNKTTLQLANFTGEHSGMPHSGYVWEESGALVGNLTLIPYSARQRKYYLIANVAVHPEHRRQGIARSLTAQAIAYAQQRGAKTIWLHVRSENSAAIDLYRTLGFAERARRTTWVCDQPGGYKVVLDAEIPARASYPSGIRITPRHGGDWQAQRKWLEQLYPPVVNWHSALQESSLQPGLSGWLYRLWNDVIVRQWSAYAGQHLSGVLTWQAMPFYSDSLWLATPGEHADDAISALLMHARQHLLPRRALSLEFPAGQASQAIQTAGFRAHQTLIWMSQDL